MPRNGSGVYSLPAGNPVVTGTTISSTWANNTLNDISTALTNSISKDGQTAPTGNLPMGTFKLTGLGSGSAATDSLNLGQAQSQSANWCGTAGGTANALTLTPSPAITAYAAGQIFRFKAGASANTAATTVAISGLSTIAVQVNGKACVGGEVNASQHYEVVVDASLTSAQLNRIGNSEGIKGPDIASAATINLDAATGDFAHVTGTTSITAITLTSGHEYEIVFDGALTLTHNATTLILPGAANITTAAGDRAKFRGDGAGNVRCMWYVRSTGLPITSVGDHEVVVHTGNGFGAVNTKIRRFSTVLTNVGTAITYADSANNGASFTINETGFYSIHYSDVSGSSSEIFGASLNSSQLTTNLQSINIADRVMLTANVSGLPGACSRTVKLSAGDIIRAHSNGVGTFGTDNTTFFAIRKIGFVTG